MHRTKSVTVLDLVGNQVTVQIREMTRAEIRRYDTNPPAPGMTVDELLQTACTPPAADALDNVPFSELRRICTEIDALTFGSEQALGNSPSTGVPSAIPAAASTVMPAAN